MYYSTPDNGFYLLCIFYCYGKFQFNSPHFVCNQLPAWVKKQIKIGASSADKPQKRIIWIQTSASPSLQRCRASVLQSVMLIFTYLQESSVVPLTTSSSELQTELHIWSKHKVVAPKLNELLEATVDGSPVTADQESPEEPWRVSRRICICNKVQSNWASSLDGINLYK